MTSTRTHLRLWIAGALAVTAVPWLRAQEGTLAPGHPDLIYAFLRHHLWLSNAVQADKRADEPLEAVEERTAAMVYQLDGPSFSKITSAVRRAQSKREELAAAEEAYAKPFLRDRRLPDIRVLAGFVEKRQNALRSMLRELQSTLAPAAYQRVLDYINQDLRKSVRTGPAPK